MSEELDTDFGSRREARETVLSILYAADNRGQSLTDYLEEQSVEPELFVSDSKTTVFIIQAPIIEG